MSEASALATATSAAASAPVSTPTSTPVSCPISDPASDPVSGPVSAPISTGAIRPASGFNPKVVLSLLLFGAIVFIAMLYFIGAGNAGGRDNNGAAHGASRGLTGYAALVKLLEADGRNVKVSRNPADLQDYGLLVLTPPQYADGEEIQAIIDKRDFSGPTLVILPKWYAFAIPDQVPVEKEEGWVFLGEATSPGWTSQLNEALQFEPELQDRSQKEADMPSWNGLGLAGKLPDETQVQSIPNDSGYTPLIIGNDGSVLAGYAGNHDVNEADGANSDSDYYRWKVTLVAEPDLLNNYGMADRNRAALAVRMIDTAIGDDNMPIIFDLTLNGLGRSQNLLTLAFMPPFLAATLCLIIAMLVVGWRAFRRFGPAAAEQRAIAFGKAQLVRNSGGFVLRTKRLHLLSEPYVDQLRHRISHKLGLRQMDDEAIDAALARRLADAPSFSQHAAALHNATSPSEILRAAHALKSIERMLAR